MNMILRIIVTIFFGVLTVVAFLVAVIRVMVTYTLLFVWDASADMHDGFMEDSSRQLKNLFEE